MESAVRISEAHFMIAQHWDQVSGRWREDGGRRVSVTGENVGEKLFLLTRWMGRSTARAPPSKAGLVCTCIPHRRSFLSFNEHSQTKRRRRGKNYLVPAFRSGVGLAFGDVLYCTIRLVLICCIWTLKNVANTSSPGIHAPRHALAAQTVACMSNNHDRGRRERL